VNPLQKAGLEKQEMEAQTMMRALALPILLLLGGCTGLIPAATDATAFENPQTGQVTDGCGPIQGFKGAVDKAQRGCDQAWQAKGWVPLDHAVAALAE
jgi:hypothetical protein